MSIFNIKRNCIAYHMKNPLSSQTLNICKDLTITRNQQSIDVITSLHKNKHKTLNFLQEKGAASEFDRLTLHQDDYHIFELYKVCCCIMPMKHAEYSQD